MTERVMGLDPGGTTGWAMWQDDPFPNTRPNDGLWQHFTCGQIGPHEHHLDLYELLELNRTNPFTIVSERFDYRKKSRGGLVIVSREYIGVAKLFAKREGSAAAPIRHMLQTPGEAMSFVTDEKLRVMGLYVPGKQHARDAMRHLITYLVMRRKMVQLTESWRSLT